tara:strand:- start:142 stop:285 length:144 start_codon:yes stop_codon:yes gene_type:complete
VPVKNKTRKSAAYDPEKINKNLFEFSMFNLIPETFRREFFGMNTETF